MGKELRRIGAPFRQPEWSSLALMEAPNRVVEAHRNFIRAGAQVITTNNYAVVPYHHTPEFFDARGLELTTLAGRLARTAADTAETDVRVAGSMPPLFGSYEPSRFDATRAAPIYAGIARALDPFVDIWLGETLSTVAEMRTVVGAIAELRGDRPIWTSFTVPDEWTDERITLRSGESMDDIVDAVVDERMPVSAVLINCSIPEQTGPALVALRSACNRRQVELELGAYANAFPTIRSGTYQANEVIFERRTELTAERYANDVSGWIADGATLVGGCCDMYPEHIRTLADRFS
jgi:S-methylmethionine-dependent homocysteine/selenocysteine methylase